MVRILIADDDDMLRSFLEIMLAQEGYEVEQASDGEMCIEIARRTSPDLIILDMNMPKLTGYETAPILRSHESTQKIPILALTADTSTESIEAAHNAGCDAHMSKPVQRDRFIRRVRAILP